MTTDAAESLRWSNLKIAMTDVQDLLRCWTCNKVFVEPVSYRCGHFFCTPCAKISGTKCGTCNVPTIASEIRQDRIVTAIVGCFNKLSNIVNEKREEVDEGKDVLSNTEKEGALTKVNKSIPSLQSTEDRAHIGDLSLNYTTAGRTHEGQTIDAENPKDETHEFLKPVQPKKVSSSGNKKSSAAKRRSLPTPSVSSDLSEEESKHISQDDLELVQPKGGIVKNPSNDILMEQKLPEEIDGDNHRDPYVTPKKTRKSSKVSNSLSSSSKKRDFGSPSSTTTPKRGSTPGRELVKRNHKGETPLHVACIKGNIDRIRSLLDAKASPNTKDNAGWTPLHEAADHGFTEVVQLLLEAGALVEVPGAGNVTPLHEAVNKNHLSIVKLLVAHGANIHARSSEGKTPLDLAASTEMKEALLNTERFVETNANNVDSGVAQEEMVLCGDSGLTQEERDELNATANILGIKVAPSLGPEVTHFIVHADENSTCAPSFDTLCAILKGVFIFSSEWLKVCKDGLLVACEELFEVKGIKDFADANAPILSRQNMQKQLPGLFNGCHFYLTSNVQYKLDGCFLNRSNIMNLIKIGGGIILSRQPDPEAIPASEQTVPYHAPRDGPLVYTSHIILYSPGKGEPELKYNMKHCKTLPVEWLIHCVLNWRLIDP